MMYVVCAGMGMGWRGIDMRMIDDMYDLGDYLIIKDQATKFDNKVLIKSSQVNSRAPVNAPIQGRNY